jgi:hypothetical protein
MSQIVLLDNVVVVTGADKKVAKGAYAFTVYGTSIGQATVTLQRKLPNGNYLAVGADAALTAFGHIGVDLPGGLYRAVVTDGGTDPVGISATLDPLE